MKHIFGLLILLSLAFSLGACHCKTCFVGGPGGCCEPCPKPPKPLKRPRPRPRCELPRFPERPVRCVTTQICRKCCHCETACTAEGYRYEIEVCEVTYKSLYTDGSSKVWTEVTRNPVTKSPSQQSGRPFRNLTWRSKSPRRGTVVGDRCDDCGTSITHRIQRLDDNLEMGAARIGRELSEGVGSEVKKLGN